MAEQVRVLVVDDNDINRRVAVGMLERLGCGVDTAPDGMEAVRLAMAGTYQVIFMDIEMPRMDGITATRAIRGHEAKAGRPRTPIAGLTCLSQSEDKARGLAAGMDDYLLKPIDAAILARTLGALSKRTITPLSSPTLGERPRTLDPAVAARLRELPDGLAVELWNEFARDLPTRCAEIDAAVSTGDALTTHRRLHALKGAAGTLGLARLQARLAICDELARQTALGWQQAWADSADAIAEARAAAQAAAQG